MTYTNIAWLNVDHTSVMAQRGDGAFVSVPQGHRWWDEIVEAIKNGVPAAEYTGE